jgi:hypothetical protein
VVGDDLAVAVAVAEATLVSFPPESVIVVDQLSGKVAQLPPESEAWSRWRVSVEASTPEPPSLAAPSETGTESEFT